MEMLQETIIVTAGIKHGGGMERYINELIENLSQRENHITVYCLKYDDKSFKNNSNVTIKQSICIQHFPRFLKYTAFALKVLWSTRKKKIPILSTARIFNPTIMIVGGTHQHHQTLMHKKNGLYDLIEIYLEKKSYQYAKRIMAHSPLIVDEIENYGLGVTNKIKMLFPPVSTKKFSFVTPENKRSYREKLKLPADKFIILIAGTEDVRKGVPVALEAMKSLPKDNLFMMIFGKTCRISLPENAKHYGIVDNINEYYAAADITLAPSLYEPFGMVVSESLQVGTPVIISDKVGAKVLVNNENGIVISEVSAKTIALSLLEAQKRTFACKKGFVQQAKLTWGEHIKELDLLLSKLM